MKSQQELKKNREEAIASFLASEEPIANAISPNSNVGVGYTNTLHSIQLISVEDSRFMHYPQYFFTQGRPVEVASGEPEVKLCLVFADGRALPLEVLLESKDSSLQYNGEHLRFSTIKGKDLAKLINMEWSCIDKKLREDIIVPRYGEHGVAHGPAWEYVFKVK